MKIEEQVCSLELAKRMKELGVKQESLFVWIQTSPGVWELELSSSAVKRSFYIGDGFCSAFTVAELGEDFPDLVYTYKYEGKWRCLAELPGLPFFDEEKEADARAKMLIYLIESGLAKPEGM